MAAMPITRVTELCMVMRSPSGGSGDILPHRMKRFCIYSKLGDQCLSWVLAVRRRFSGSCQLPPAADIPLHWLWSESCQSTKSLLPRFRALALFDRRASERAQKVCCRRSKPLHRAQEPTYTVQQIAAYLDSISFFRASAHPAPSATATLYVMSAAI